MVAQSGDRSQFNSKFLVPLSAWKLFVAYRDVRTAEVGVAAVSQKAGEIGSMGHVTLSHRVTRVLG